MERLTKFYVGILALSVLFAAWGLVRWLQARELTVRSPVPMAAAARYVYLKPERAFPLSRYAHLQQGSLFFGPESVETLSGASAALKVEFKSELLLYGVTTGTTSQTDRAVVGLIGDSKSRTWLAGVGTVINGETVVKIEDKAIWVKNATGKGRVGLKPE